MLPMTPRGRWYAASPRAECPAGCAAGAGGGDARAGAMPVAAMPAATATAARRLRRLWLLDEGWLFHRVVALFRWALTEGTFRRRRARPSGLDGSWRSTASTFAAPRAACSTMRGGSSRLPARHAAPVKARAGERMHGGRMALQPTTRCRQRHRPPSAAASPARPRRRCALTAVLRRSVRLREARRRRWVGRPVARRAPPDGRL